MNETIWWCFTSALAASTLWGLIFYILFRDISRMLRDILYELKKINFSAKESK